MEGFIIFFTTGLLIFLSGLLLLKREIRLFKTTVITNATVVKYYEYKGTHNSDHNTTMYTMVVEYKLSDGKSILASEQNGSNRKKYPIGTELEIGYSEEKPDMFNVKGDYSRKIIMLGMIIVGLGMVIISGLVAINI